MNRIVVTGMGIISAIGDTVNANRNSLIHKKSGITSLTQFKTHYAANRPCGEIKLGNEELKIKLGVDDPGVTRTSLLALDAFNQAVQDAGLSDNQLRQSDTAFIGASTVGGMCLTDELYHDANRAVGGSPYLASYDNASVDLFLQQRYGLGGFVNTINTACSSSANAIMMGARMLQLGMASTVIAGGADSLAKFTINGFNALHILSPQHCKPFDQERSGLNLGEAAAFLVLQREADVRPEAKKYAALTGYANTNDSYHPSSLSPDGEGPFLAMKNALDIAGLCSADIDFINAHGTATENNDAVESIAMIRLFATPPPFVSTKANTGHTLGAAGAVEAVFSVLSLFYGERYPSANFEKPIADTLLTPVTAYSQEKLKHVMSNSFGFGGNCSSLIFSSIAF